MTMETAPEEPPIDAGAGEVEAPHETSMVVWDTPSPAIVGRPVTLMVGVQCACACDLTGQPVELRDEDGAVIAAGRLGEPVAGTQALFGCRLSLPGPAATGVRALTAAYTPENLAPAHLGSSAPVGFRIDPKPEHQVAVRVVRAADGEVASGVEVRMNHYEAYTDAEGVARFDLPAGDYSCTIRKLGLQAEPLAVSVPGQRLVEVTAGKGETREELETRLSRWEDQPWA